MPLPHAPLNRAQGKRSCKKTLQDEMLEGSVTLRNWVDYQFLHQGHLWLKPLDTDKTLAILGSRRDVKMRSIEAFPLL